jgi:hypothetical protein
MEKGLYVLQTSESSRAMWLPSCSTQRIRSPRNMLPGRWEPYKMTLHRPLSIQKTIEFVENEGVW